MFGIVCVFVCLCVCVSVDEPLFYPRTLINWKKTILARSSYYTYCVKVADTFTYKGLPKLGCT